MQSVLKEFLKYASLNVLGMLGLSCYILADTFFISQGLGANGLAALNLAIPVYSIIHGCGLMLGMGGAIKFSVYRSQGKQRQADAVFTNTLILAAVFTALFVLTGVFLSQPLTKLLGADASVFEMTHTYLQTMLLFSPAFLLNEVLLCFIRNDGRPQLSMSAMIGGSLSNIVLDYVFIFPLQMGMFGAIFATGLAPVISMLILSPHFLKRKNNFHCARIVPRQFRSRSIFSLGFPSFVTELSSGVVILVFNSILLRMEGNVGVAAYGVIANLSLVVLAVFTGIAQGAQPLISREYGLGNTQRSKQLLRCAVMSSLVLSAGIYLIFSLWASPIVELFNSEQNILLQQVAETGLLLYFTGIFFAGFNIVLCAFFAASERPLPAHAVSLSRGLILVIPAAFLLSAAFGITGVWLSFPAAELLTVCLGVTLYAVCQKRSIS